MAKLERTLNGDFDIILNTITRGIQSGSITASLEESSDFYADGARCSVRIFERYSWLGSNRVSMSVTLFQADGKIYISASTSGGSQAAFFKINTFGEQAFLDKIRKIIYPYETY